MDKSTLSNYGWIVICTLVLVVMIALSGPFGTFVSEAVQSTTQGLFDVNYNALNAAGIEVNNQSFDTAFESGEKVNKNEYNFYFNTPYRAAMENNGEIVFAEIIFYENGSVVMNTYSDMNYTNILGTEAGHVSEFTNGGTYADLPVIEDGKVVLGFSDDGRLFTFFDIVFSVSGNYEKPAPVLNEYGFYFNAEYALTDRCFIGNYLTYEFRADTSVVIRWYADSNYTTPVQTMVSTNSGMSYGAGYIHSNNSFEGAAYETITFRNNGRMLRGSDIDLSYNCILLDDYKELVKGINNPIVFAAGDYAFAGTENMTWNDFVNSAYNRDGYFRIENGVVFARDGQIYTYLISSNGVTSPGDIEASDAITLETYNIWK